MSPRLLTVFPEEMYPGMVAEFVGGKLGDDWLASGVSEPTKDIEALRAADVILTFATITDQDLDLVEHLQLIQTPGHGYDHIDVDAAAERGIPVANVGSSGAEDATVAEHALGLAMACARRLPEGHEDLRNGRWSQQALIEKGMNEVSGKTLGIVGMGQIGRQLARMAGAFQMTVLYHDRQPDPEVDKAHGARRVELGQLLEQADVVSLHLPLSESSRGMIGREELGRMRPGAILVNTSRGALVDDDALLAALEAGHVRAGLDVFDPEPPPSDHPLLRAPNVVLSPHTAGVTAESLKRIMAAAIENLARVGRGEAPWDVVNGVGV